MSAVASSIRVSAPVKAGKAAAFNRGARVASVRPALPKARVSTVVRAREVGMKTDGTSATGRKPNPQYAKVDGSLWVCQGCGYIYDGSLGQWAENKRCPACGERRFALKTQAEMNIAVQSLGVTGLLIFALIALVKLA